ncbi:TPA: hypothetical protein MHS45_16535 [Klebsiella pneumoniae]|nr:hypothetical protein [Klebsiella pneumoniae]HBX2452464.1 hypothetical protein [Klebsiella pneumoniae]
MQKLKIASYLSLLIVITFRAALLSLSSLYISPEFPLIRFLVVPDLLSCLRRAAARQHKM